MNSKPMEVTKPRNANYKLKAIADAFEPVSPDQANGTCANIKFQVDSELDDYDNCLCATTSAAYVLARLCALFNGLQIEALGQESYKVTWNTVLKHKATGHVVTFYDYKGGASFGSDVSGKDVPNEFIADLKKLIKVLKDDRCPHPYDGCVVGEVA